MGDLGSVSVLERSPGEGNGNPLHYSGLENSRDRESGGIQSMGSQIMDMPERFSHSHSSTLIFLIISIAGGD